MQERWGQIKEIFGAALELEGEERRRYVAAACNGDTQLFSEVQGLLDADEEAGEFIETPIANLSNLDEKDPLLGTEIGPYRLLDRVGEGGMGVVYKAVRTLDDVE